MQTWFLVALATLCVHECMVAQSRSRPPSRPEKIFEAGLFAGRSFSQLDGDYFTGFDKGGWYGGIRGKANLTTNTALLIEMLYSQKGSRIPHGTIVSERSINDRLVSMEFAEIPIIIRHKLSDSDHPGYVEFGGFYGRLIHTEIEERASSLSRGGTRYEDIASEFKTFELGLLAGVGLTILRNLELGFRYSFALTRIYENDDFALPPPGSIFEKEVEFLRNYHLTLLIAYQLL